MSALKSKLLGIITKRVRLLYVLGCIVILSLLIWSAIPNPGIESLKIEAIDFLENKPNAEQNKIWSNIIENGTAELEYSLFKVLEIYSYETEKEYLFPNYGFKLLEYKDFEIVAIEKYDIRKEMSLNFIKGMENNLILKFNLKNRELERVRIPDFQSNYEFYNNKLYFFYKGSEYVNIFDINSQNLKRVELPLRAYYIRKVGQSLILSGYNKNGSVILRNTLNKWGTPEKVVELGRFYGFEKNGNKEIIVGGKEVSYDVYECAYWRKDSKGNWGEPLALPLPGDSRIMYVKADIISARNDNTIYFFNIKNSNLETYKIASMDEISGGFLDKDGDLIVYGLNNEKKVVVGRFEKGKEFSGTIVKQMEKISDVFKENGNLYAIGTNKAGGILCKKDAKDWGPIYFGNVVWEQLFHKGLISFKVGINVKNLLVSLLALLTMAMAGFFLLPQSKTLAEKDKLKLERETPSSGEENLLQDIIDHTQNKLNWIVRNSYVLLIAGIGMSFLGVVTFIMLLPGNRDPENVWQFFKLIVRPTSILLFMEGLAIFFLKQYRYLFNDYKYFHQIFLRLFKFQAIPEILKGKGGIYEEQKELLIKQFLREDNPITTSSSDNLKSIEPGLQRILMEILKKIPPK